MAPSGFYKLEDGATEPLFAPNFVVNAEFELTRETHDATPSAGGWAWFESEDEARTALGVV